MARIGRGEGVRHPSKKGTMWQMRAWRAIMTYPVVIITPPEAIYPPTAADFSLFSSGPYQQQQQQQRGVDIGTERRVFTQLCIGVHDLPKKKSPRSLTNNKKERRMPLNPNGLIGAF